MTRKERAEQILIPKLPEHFTDRDSRWLMAQLVAMPFFRNLKSEETNRIKAIARRIERLSKSCKQ